MEPLVKEIIAMDMAARKKVEEVQQARTDVKKQADISKTEIEQAAMHKAEQRLASLKEQYAQQTKAAKQKSEAEYEAALTQLQQKFQLHKDAWLKEIVERCIHQ